MKKLLIFDCEKDIADCLKDIFEEKDFEVVVATSAQDVIRKVEMHKPNTVLLDLMFHRGFDYVGLIRCIKEISPNTKIIATTAIDGELQIERAFNAGAVRCVPKPSSIEDLERIVEETIEGKSSDPNWGWENNIGNYPPEY